MRSTRLCIVVVCCLAGFCASGAVPSETGRDQAASHIQELATKAAYFLPSFDQADGHCEVTCNNEDVDTVSIYSTSEPRTCVGTLKVFCTGNSTTGLSVAGFKCEGKSTFFQRTAICEGALQNFIKKGFKTPEGKLIKSTKAYGCLGTSIGISFNSSSDTAYANGFKPADASAVEAILAGEKRSLEGRCDGLSVQFQAVKVGDGCDKHLSKGSKHADRQQATPADQLDYAEAQDPSFVLAQSGTDLIHLPGAQRSLAGHHDKHGKKHSGKGKHHHDRDDNDEEDDKARHRKQHKHSDKKHSSKGTHDDDRHDIDGDVKNRHHKQHSDKGPKHSDKHAHAKHTQMTFEDAEDKVQHLMHKSGVEWLPRELPSGSGQIEGSRGPNCQITCNGRRTWFGAFFPCFGELRVDCEGGSQPLPNHISGSNLDTTQAADHGFEFHGACKGYWSGALFKSCRGFSTSHVEVKDTEVWDFCAGKKAVRMGAQHGKGFFSSSACRGKDLLVLEKEE